MQPIYTTVIIVFAFALLWHLPEIGALLRNRARQRRRAESKRPKVVPIDRHPRMGSVYTEEY